MFRFQRKCLLVLAILVGLLVVGLAQPAGAVVNGTPDGTAHRNAGVVVIVDAAGLHEGCSGVLMAPTVFVTAGHCLAHDDYGPLAEQGRLFVSFAPTLDLTTTAGDIKAVHAEGLFPAIDIGVVVLAEPARDAQGPIAPAALPTAGLLDGLAATGELTHLPLTVVGYGVSAWIDNRTPDFSTLGTRRNGPQLAQALPPGHPGYLLLSESLPGPNRTAPSPGDSGGPYFLGDSDTVVGTVVGPTGAGSQGTTVATRLDTPEVRSLLASFGVPLP